MKTRVVRTSASELNQKILNRGSLRTRILDPRNGLAHECPNKLARGMSETIYRSGHELLSEAATLSLVVNGSTDALRGVRYLVQRIPCPCCGAKQNGKYKLNDYGRRKLKRLRNALAGKL
jgi:hypothetical protein